MQFEIRYGHRMLTLGIGEDRLIPLQHEPIAPSVPDPIAGLRDALEKPHDFPALRRALTPDDHIAIVVDEHLSRLPELLTAVLEHVARAGIGAGAVTIICPRSDSRQEWIEGLPDEWQDVHVEVHDPTERRRLAYLATTKHGRRIYLNRTAVDAEQTILLTGLGHHALLGYSGAATALFPALSDEATLRDERLARPDRGRAPRQAAEEVARVLDARFRVAIRDVA